MDRDAITLLDQIGQLTRIESGIFFLLREGKLEYLALKFDRALAASLSRQERTETQFVESPLNPIEALPAEGELAARLRDGIFVDLMGAQHLVLDLSEIARVEESHFEELGAHGFRVQVERTGRQQGLFLSRRGHGKTVTTGHNTCQVINAHMTMTPRGNPDLP